MPILDRWVEGQCWLYKLLQSGKLSSLTNDQLELLGSIGFVWEPHNDDWIMWFKQLKEYKAKMGNCMVPQIYAENEKLGWLSNL